MDTMNPMRLFVKFPEIFCAKHYICAIIKIELDSSFTFYVLVNKIETINITVIVWHDSVRLTAGPIHVTAVKWMVCITNSA